MSDINKFITSPIPKIIKKISILEKNTNKQIKEINHRIDDIHGFQGPQGHNGFQGVQGPQGYNGFQGFQGIQGSQGYTGFQGFQGVQGASFDPTFNILSVTPFWTNKLGGDTMVLTTRNLPFYSQCFMDEVQVQSSFISSTGKYTPISKNSAEITSTVPIRESRNYNTSLKIIGPYWEDSIIDIQYYQLVYDTSPPATINPNITFDVVVSVQDNNRSNLTNVSNMQLDVSSVPSGIIGTLSKFVGTTGKVTFNNLSLPTNSVYLFKVSTHSQPNSTLASTIICGDVTPYVPLNIEQIDLGYNQDGTYRYYFYSLFISNENTSFLVHDVYYGYGVLSISGAIIRYQLNNSTNKFNVSQIITPNTTSTSFTLDGLHANNDLSEFITFEQTNDATKSHVYLYTYNGTSYSNSIMSFPDLSEDVPNNYGLYTDRSIGKLVLNNMTNNTNIYTSYYRTSTYHWEKSGIILYTGSHPSQTGPTDEWPQSSYLYISGDGNTIGITDGFDIFIYNWNNTSHLYELTNTLTPTNPANLPLSGIMLNNTATTLIVNGNPSVLFSFSRPNSSSSTWTELTAITNVNASNASVIHNNITDNGNKFACLGNSNNILLFTKTTEGTEWTLIHEYTDLSSQALLTPHITKFGSQIIIGSFLGTTGKLYSIT